MDRRDFIKASLAGMATAGLASCSNGSTAEGSGSSSREISGNVPVRLNGSDRVGLLGFGCMRWPMVKDADGNDIIDQEAVNEMVDKALAHGVNYYDSSPVYLQGKSEQAAATALLRHPRESYLIATKLSVWESDRQKCIDMYRRSLDIYKTDHIDYYLLHSMNGADNFRRRFVDTGIWDFLQKEKAAGHIRNLGFSFHGDKNGFDSLMALHDSLHWDFVQIQMNYVDWTHAKDDATAEYMYAELDRREIPIVIMEPLLGGRLASIPATQAERLKASEPGRSIASWAFRFCGSFPRVLTVLSGMNCMDHLEDNLRTFTEFSELGSKEFELLYDVAAQIDKYPLINCTGCQYCMPCPYGIDIPGIFRFYNRHVNEGTYVTSPEQKNYARARRKYLMDYDSSVEKVRQADHCITCGKCRKACPQRIRIPDELRRIDEYIEKVRRGEI
ncbi:MAG: aldo/keto reductase [Bacteroidales bacterium]|nr:aldo/keto reductase [Bacteroidales bacterium]